MKINSVTRSIRLAKGNHKEHREGAFIANMARRKETLGLKIKIIEHKQPSGDLTLLLTIINSFIRVDED